MGKILLTTVKRHTQNLATVFHGASHRLPFPMTDVSDFAGGPRKPNET